VEETRLNDLVRAVAAVITAHCDELTALDQAIGDGDHGLNLKRGAEAVVAELAKLSGKPIGEVLRAAGMQIVMKVGGASGPLMGTWAMEMGKHLPPAPAYADVARAMEAAFVAVKARGKSEEGQKTMLDVLGPTVRAMQANADPASVKAIAQASAEATIPIKATRGRASFLGDRSIGHMDPGARSSSLIIATVCDQASTWERAT
jgi:phosphoenolpyruvate---glycerone phosphotransferase subunit DhaL